MASRPGTSTVVAETAGGSDALALAADRQVGARNVEAANDVLEAFDVSIAGTDVGGDHGRSPELDPATGTLLVTATNAGERRR